MSGEEAGMGESGVGEGLSGSVVQSRLSYFSLSISFSLSHHNKGKKKKKKKKNACTRTPKFLCIS